LRETNKSGHEVALLLLAIAATVFIAIFIVKFIPKKVDVKKVEKTLDDVSVDWEIKFKKSMLKYIREDSRIIINEKLNESITEIKNRLLENINENPYEIEIIIVNSPMTNAFTFPGGLIVIYSPLIRSTDNPQELASVIAHEMGHIIHRDPLKRLVRQLGVSTVLSMLGGGGESTVFFENIVNDFVNAHYNRTQEDDADKFALELLDSCDIDPMHFCNFMKKLDIEKKDSMQKIAKHFMSHPDTKSRIEKARKYAEQFNRKEKPFNIDWNEVKRLLPSVFG
jgi:predicted Zn-dependent protease